MESRSAGCVTATGAAERMQPDKAIAAATTMIGSRNARATRTGAIPQSETALVLHQLWLTNRFLEAGSTDTPRGALLSEGGLRRTGERGEVGERKIRRLRRRRSG